MRIRVEGFCCDDPVAGVHLLNPIYTGASCDHQAGMDEADAAAKVQAAAPAMAAWLQAYMRQQPQATVSMAGPGFDGDPKKGLCIQVHATPHRILSTSKQNFVSDFCRLRFEL